MTERYQPAGAELALSRNGREALVRGSYMVRKLERKKPVIDAVITAVANEHYLSEAQILGPSRRKDIVIARNTAAYLLYLKVGLTFQAVAFSLGRVDHTTAMHAVASMEKLMETDPNLKERISNYPLSPQTSS